MIRPSPHVVLLGVCVAATAFGPFTASAGSHKAARPHPASSPSDSPAAAQPQPGVPASAHVRLWKAGDGQAGAALPIRWLPAAGNTGVAVTMTTNADRYQFGGYEDVPSGAGVIEIAPAGQPPLRLGVQFAPDQTSTLLVRVRGGVPSAEILDDAVAGEGNGPSFNVFNLLFGGKGEVLVGLGDALTAHLSAAGGALRAQGIKPAFYQVTVNGTDNDGQALRWNTETDLRKVHRATLIICPDAYGRIRPRLIEDGAPTEATPASKAGSASNE